MPFKVSHFLKRFKLMNRLEVAILSSFLLRFHNTSIHLGTHHPYLNFSGKAKGLLSAKEMKTEMIVCVVPIVDYIRNFCRTILELTPSFYAHQIGVHCHRSSKELKQFSSNIIWTYRTSAPRTKQQNKNKCKTKQLERGSDMYRQDLRGRKWARQRMLIALSYNRAFHSFYSAKRSFTCAQK